MEKKDWEKVKKYFCYAAQVLLGTHIAQLPCQENESLYQLFQQLWTVINFRRVCWDLPFATEAVL